MVNIKEQIFEIFKTRFKSAGVESPKLIFIFYEKGKKIKIGYDLTPPNDSEISFSDNFIMSSFVISQVKGILSKQFKRVDILNVIVMLDLHKQSIKLECIYNHKEAQNEIFKHTL